MIDNIPQSKKNNLNRLYGMVFIRKRSEKDWIK